MNVAAGHVQKKRLFAISCSVIVGLFLMAVKFYAYRLTRSAAILSDALESIINVIASGFALGSIIVAAKPPDASHPYGHGKIEYFSAGFEGALIIAAALGIWGSAWKQFLRPHGLLHLDIGVMLLVGTSLVNFLLGYFLVQVGKRTRSLALVADGKHVLTDVFTSVGVILGLVAVRLTSWIWIDGAIALAVGIHILFSGIKLVHQSFSGLMDASDPGLLEEIAAVLRKHRKDVWIDVHRLRAGRYGNRVRIDFHLILPATLSLEKAHREVKAVEEHLLEHFDGQADILIHMDPCDEPDCPVCRLQACGQRKHRAAEHNGWTLDTLTAGIPRGMSEAGDESDP